MATTKNNKKIWLSGGIPIIIAVSIRKGCITMPAMIPPPAPKITVLVIGLCIVVILFHLKI